MTQIWKRRARKPIATGKTDTGYYPSGVGGMLLGTPCVCLTVDDYRVIIPTNEFIFSLKSLRMIDSHLFAMIINEANKGSVEQSTTTNYLKD